MYSKMKGKRIIKYQSYLAIQIAYCVFSSIYSVKANSKQTQPNQKRGKETLVLWLLPSLSANAAQERRALAEDRLCRRAGESHLSVPSCQPSFGPLCVGIGMSGLFISLKGRCVDGLDSTRAILSLSAVLERMLHMTWCQKKSAYCTRTMAWKKLGI